MATVDEALRRAETKLRDAGIEGGARLEATLLLGHVLDLSRAGVLAALADELAAGPEAAFGELVSRRAGGEPLQYLRGRAPFLDFELEVGPGVFVPRPETELLVERALRMWPDDGSWAIELGTGSGAIAIGLARARPGGRVLSIDRSTLALATAARNAARLGVADRVALICGDLLSPLARQGSLPTNPGASTTAAPVPASGAARRRPIGLLVSNPPYVADQDPIDTQVRAHEPRAAWNAGPTGLVVFERLLAQAAAVLPAGAPLLLELGAGQDLRVSDLLRRIGSFDEPSTEPDYRGIARVLATRRSRA